MLDQVLTSIKILISAIVLVFTSILGFQEKTDPLPPSPSPNSIEIATTSATIPSASPSGIPIIKTKKQPSPVPTLLIDLDLNLENVFFWPQKIRDPAAMRKIIDGSSDSKFKQTMKLDFINITIRNNGHEKALQTVVNLIVDGESIHQRIIDVIDPQSAKTEKIDIDFPSKIGKHKMEVQINPGRLFQESRFDNNTKIYEYEYTD